MLEWLVEMVAISTMKDVGFETEWFVVGRLGHDHR